MTNQLSSRLIYLFVFLVYSFQLLPKRKNKILNQGRFWPFAPRQLLGVIYFLISSFQLNLANNYYFHEKLEVFTYK